MPEIICSLCLMNIEAGEEEGEEEDEDDHEERIVLKILHDGMFTPSGAVKKEDSKNVYSYIEKICHDNYQICHDIIELHYVKYLKNLKYKV